MKDSFMQGVEEAIAKNEASTAESIAKLRDSLGGERILNRSTQPNLANEQLAAINKKLSQLVDLATLAVQLLEKRQS